jgi:choline dehydrogenase-like flavoprotein
VVGFELDGANGRLSSIEAGDRGGRRLKVCADTFIFAAGTIESTRLLLLLNRSSSERAFERCLVLGRYFQDHLDVRVGRLRPVNKRLTSRVFGTHYLPRMRRRLRLELTPQAQKTNRVANAFAHVTSEIWEHRSIKFLREFAHGVRQGCLRCSWTEAANLVQDAGELTRLSYSRFVERHLYYPERVPLDLRLVVEQLPSWENRIGLSEQVDEFGVQRSKLVWQPTLADERTFRVCLDKVGSYWVRSGLGTFCPIDWAPGAEDPSSLLIEQARDTCHPSGTTRMGIDPVHSVVGPDLRCHAVPNVYVVSASVFPSSGAANPTLTLAQLALRCADSVLEGGAPTLPITVLSGTRRQTWRRARASGERIDLRGAQIGAHGRGVVVAPQTALPVATSPAEVKGNSHPSGINPL